MAPIRFVFGLHPHQPVGNFDHVFEQHVQDVYRPILQRLSEREFLPLVLHLSGPLLEWLEEHDSSYLDLLGGLVSSGKVELLLAGFYEPVLASLPRADRVEQIQWMKDAVRRRFGVDAAGLWLTERVWEPELAADLADAGVRYAVVDDRHFQASGYSNDQLHAPYWTESDGKRVALFPIDERLRYLIPFRPPEETAAYLRELRGAGHRLAVLADDGEKFGGWPGTKEWVY
jgi:alpha-amylase